MPRETKKFEFTLYFDEAEQIRGATGEGGQQDFHRFLIEQLDNNDNTVTLDDAQFGTLARYMTLYGPGGFQGRLRKAFRRSIVELFNNMGS